MVILLRFSFHFFYWGENHTDLEIPVHWWLCGFCKMLIAIEHRKQQLIFLSLKKFLHLLIKYNFAEKNFTHYVSAALLIDFRSVFINPHKNVTDNVVINVQ